MSPVQVRVVGHHKNLPMVGDEVLAFVCLPRFQPKRPLLTERNRHDRSTIDHVHRAVWVLANVVASTSVVPNHKQTVQSIVDRIAAPALQRLQEVRECRDKPVWNRE